MASCGRRRKPVHGAAIRTEERMDFEIVNPDPSGTISSLRSLGYSVESAIADLIDNSLAARARSVDVVFTWAGRDSWVAVVDDGKGMDNAELVCAMTIAGTGEQLERDQTDLGRFGMGLKTASFSQASRLTVSTATGGDGWSTRTWDLELVRSCREWRLLNGCDPGTDAILARLRRRNHGTIVLWRALHRFDVDDVRDDDVEARRLFYGEAHRVEDHAAMVFTRLLAGRGAVAMTVNGTTVESWDPFLSDCPATRQRPSEELLVAGRTIRVTPYLLPHPGRFTQEEYRRAGGPAGWLDQQGFYVFRRDRLILAGDWLGLRGLRRDEKCNLARIAVDVPAELDREWAVDVRKSAVVPPVATRDRLTRIARSTRESARETSATRGRLSARSHSADFVYPWMVTRPSDRIACRINRQHPLVSQALAGNDAREVRSLLRLLEETVPVAALRVLHEPDTADDPEPFHEAATEETVSVARSIYTALLNQGSTPNQARRRLAQMEPFDRIDGFWRGDSSGGDTADPRPTLEAE